MIVDFPIQFSIYTNCLLHHVFLAWEACGSLRGKDSLQVPRFETRYIFLRVLQFSPLLKNQHFQIQIRSRNARQRLNEFFELLGAPWVDKLSYVYIYKMWNNRQAYVWILLSWNTSKLVAV